MKLKEALNTKNKIHDKINSITDFHAVWEYNPETKACRLIIEGTYMKKGMGKNGLTEADKEWIANLMITTVKPIQEDIHSLKEDMVDVKNRLKAIENCPTIKKELK